MLLKFFMEGGTSAAFLEKGNGNSDMDDGKKGEERHLLLNDKEIDA
jgi:hypothetical protein